MPRAQGGDTSPCLQGAASSRLGGGQGTHLAAQFILFILQPERPGVSWGVTSRGIGARAPQGLPTAAPVCTPPASDSQSLSRATF